MLNLKTKEPLDGAIVSDLPIPPDFLLESELPVEDHPPAVLQVTVRQVVQAEGAWMVRMGMGLSLVDLDWAWGQTAEVERRAH